MALGLSLLAGCGVRPHHTLNGGSAAKKISAELSRRYQGTTPDVTCPSGAPVHAGQMFVCQVTIDGQPLTITGTITASDGTFSLAPSAAIIPIASTVTALEKSINGASSVPATVTCGSRALLVVTAGKTFTCSATLGAEPPRQVVVTVHNVDGDISYMLVRPAQ